MYLSTKLNTASWHFQTVVVKLKSDTHSIFFSSEFLYENVIIVALKTFLLKFCFRCWIHRRRKRRSDARIYFTLLFPTIKLITNTSLLQILYSSQETTPHCLFTRLRPSLSHHLSTTWRARGFVGNPAEFPVCGVVFALPTHQQPGRLLCWNLCIHPACVYMCALPPTCAHTHYLYMYVCSLVCVRVCVHFMEVSGFTLPFI